MFAREVDEQVPKVNFAKDHANWWHNDVIDEGVDNLSEGSSHNDANGPIQYIATDHELFEVLKQVGSPHFVSKAYAGESAGMFEWTVDTVDKGGPLRLMQTKRTHILRRGYARRRADGSTHLFIVTHSGIITWIHQLGIMDALGQGLSALDSIQS